MNEARLTDRAHAIVSDRLRVGDIAIDATVGNGHDTLFLADAVGDTGRVFGFDVQAIALHTARARLVSAGFDGRVTLIASGHEEMSERLPEEARGRVAAVMFNLGYLPGSDRAVVTQPDTTAAGLEAAAALLRPGGIISVLVYTGHPGGTAELEAVRGLCSRWGRAGFAVESETRAAPRSPVLFTAVRS